MNADLLSKEGRGGDCSSSSRASSGSGRRATRDLFLTCTATPRRRGETDDDFLGRITHLRLQNKGISSLGSGDVFEACRSLKVLYMYENCIDSLRGLGWLRHLEQLHVDNNVLTSIDNTLLSCRRLTKLHLSGNNIARLSGLESARCLQELHVARQRLPLGQALSFDRASIVGIKDSLVVLDASGNGIGGEDIELLLDLYRLETLNLADNAIENMAQVIDLVTSLEVLRNCDLRGNTVSRKPKYFERAVTRSGDCLTTLDGKSVHAQHREALQKLDRHKHRRIEARERSDGSKALPKAPMVEQTAPMAEMGAPYQAWTERNGNLATTTVATDTKDTSSTDVPRLISNNSQNTSLDQSAARVEQNNHKERRGEEPKMAWVGAQRAVSVPLTLTIAGNGSEDDDQRIISWPH